MSAFASMILLFIIAFLAMSLVAYSNYKVEQKKKIRLQIQKLKYYADELETIVLGLDEICSSARICQLVNDEVVTLYQEMIDKDDTLAYLKIGLDNANARSREFSQDDGSRTVSRVCSSDADIGRARVHIAEATRIIRDKQEQGVLKKAEAEKLISDLSWLNLQVYVISNIVQGHKAFAIKEMLTANAFYKKAQNELKKSQHPHRHREPMIDQVNDMIYGRRKCLDAELMPETEFNPEDVVLSEEEQETLDKIVKQGETPDDASTAKSASG